MGLYVVAEKNKKQQTKLQRGHQVKTLDGYVSTHPNLKENPEENKRMKRCVEFFEVGSYISCAEFGEGQLDYFSFFVQTECWEDLRKNYEKAGFKIQELK